MVDIPRLPGESFSDWWDRMEAAENPQPPKEESNWSPNTWDPALIPQVQDDSNLSDEDRELNRIIQNIDMMQAYDRWIGKTVDQSTVGRTDGVMVSCPFPHHADPPPPRGKLNAWIKPSARLWHCGKCEAGGDIYDLAAFHFDMEGYKKDPGIFIKLRERMAEDFGYTVKRLPGNQKMIIPPDDEPESQPQEQSQATQEPEPSNVTPLHLVEPGEDEDDEATQLAYPSLNWREIVPQDTFLWEYMEATSNDDLPEEYHFWHGLLALGHAVGRNVTLDDTRLVYGNLMLCLLGRTGAGKSGSRGWLTEVIEDVLPFNMSMSPPSGVKQVSSAGSGEYLIATFMHAPRDPISGQSLGGQSINGIVDFDEMSQIIKTVNRQGNILGSIVMQMADAKPRVTSGSLTGGERVAIKPFCSIATSTQPKAIRTLFSTNDAGSGFLNRWVFAAGPPKKREAIGGQRSRIKVDLSTAKERLRIIRTWGATERNLILSDTAAEEWERYFHNTVEPIKQKDEADLLNRLDLILKKLFLLFAINSKEAEVSVDTVKRVENITDYLLQCYALLNDNIGITKSKEISDEILRHILRLQNKTGRGATLREIGLRVKHKNWTDKQIWDALTGLEQMEKIEAVKPPPGPGRKSPRYKVVGE